jgi:hypothetical protein
MDRPWQVLVMVAALSKQVHVVEMSLLKQARQR